MLSVTSETATLPLPNASSRSARPDQAPAQDDFSALIDSNAGSIASDRPAATPPDRASPPQRIDNTSAASDRAPRYAASPSSAAADMPSQAADPSAAAADPAPDAPAKLEKAGTAKPDLVKTTAKDTVLQLGSATDLAGAVDAQPAAAAMGMPAPVAVAIAAPFAIGNAVATSSAPDGMTKPLAIAAAAIAASLSTSEPPQPAAASAQAPTAPVADPAASPTSAASDTVALPVAVAAPVDVVEPGMALSDPTQPAAGQSVADPGSDSAEKPVAVIQADPDLTAVVPAMQPVTAMTPKAGTKTPVAARTGDAAPPTGSPGTSDDADVAEPAGLIEGAGNRAAKQAPNADAKQQTGSIPTSVTNAEMAMPDRPAATGVAAPHERHPSAPQIQTDAIDAGQIPAAAQPSTHSLTAPSPAQQFSVTASNILAVPLNGLALQIAVTAQSGRSRFEISLDPAELGRIDVRIDVDRHGQISSHLTVEKPETLAMLRQDAPQLQRALDNAGFKTGEGGLQFSLRDQSSPGQNGNDMGRNAQRLVISEDDSVPAAIAGRSYGRAPGSGGGVDIRV